METITIELIRLVFGSAIMLITAWIMRPAIRFLRSPMPQFDLSLPNYLEEAEEEIQIPTAPAEEDFDRFETITTARAFPLKTTHVVRQWIRESPSLKSHA
ncbi:MAG: hypothetical protein HQM14_08965 [SAR324 cluster bacterium]|nr:hypothetical protein [SAR324 cluster bacterium]